MCVCGVGVGVDVCVCVCVCVYVWVYAYNLCNVKSLFQTINNGILGLTRHNDLSDLLY